MGLLILEGMLAFEMRVGDRTTTELVGAGDLLQAPTGRGDELLEGLASLEGPAVRRAWPCSTRSSPTGSGRGRRSARR